ncbi:MAG: Membrane transport protein [candidate division BRC1 bacterium ADurb.BinA292]|nr:MAG: Membrane transport protein [candidate division BRC1 bacterium ADurb.BinA292]
MNVFNSLAPIFLIIGLGALLSRIGFLTPPLVAGANAFAYWIALPALLFRETATAQVNLAGHWDAFAVLLGGMLVCVAAGYLAAWVIRLPGQDAGTLVQAAFRGNLAYIGLAVVILSAENGASDPAALSVLMLAGIVPFYNVVAVIVLLASQHRFEWGAVRRVLRQLASNPLIIASVAGALVMLSSWSLPAVVDRTLRPIAQTGLPLALLGIGATLHSERIRGGWLPVGTAGLIKVALAPAFGILAGGAIGLTPDELRIVLIYLACPTAAASYVMADQLGGNRILAAGCVVFSTLASFVSLSVILGLVQ